MNKYLPLKLVGNAFIVVLFLNLLTEATFIGSLMTAVVFSLITYVVGDLGVLPKTNNALATAVDVVMAAVYFLLVAKLANWSLSAWDLVTVVVILGAFEFVFHLLLLREMNSHKDRLPA